MINGKLIKVCGMRSEANISEVEALGIDLMGFIFYNKSPRYVDHLPEYTPTKCRRVGVFVNEDIDVVLERYAEFELDFVQLHGNESADYCDQLRTKEVKIIKAISVAERADLESYRAYEAVCDMLLLDTKCSDYGGSGQKFNWSILNDFNPSIPFLLSGGIGVDDTRSISLIKNRQLVGYDVNSRFEIEPAIKDVELINRFVKELKTVDYNE